MASEWMMPIGYYVRKAIALIAKMVPIDNISTLFGDVITIKDENPLKSVYIKDILRRISEVERGRKS